MLDAAQLSGLHFAAGLPPQTLAELAGMASIQSFAPQRVVFREGDRCADIFLLRSGRVALDMHVPGRGSPDRVNRLHPNHFASRRIVAHLHAARDLHPTARHMI